MPLDLKNIGQKILHPFKTDAKVTNPLLYLNPLTVFATPVLLYKNLNTLQKQQAAKKAAEMGVPVDSLTYEATPDGRISVAGSASDAPASAKKLPTWAIISISLAGVAAVVGIGVLIYKVVKK